MKGRRGLSKSPTAALLLVMILALSGCQGTNQGDGASTDQDRQETTGGGGTTGKKCKPGRPTDNIIADPDGSYDKVLVRRADNIFVGRVIEKTGLKPSGGSGSPLPVTSFAIKVERNVKGSLSGTVTVDQAGGCDPKYGRVVLINDDPLLKPGERAVFSTEAYRSPAGTHYIVGSRYGDMRVETRAEENEIIARLRDDKKEFVPFGLGERRDG